MLSKVASREHGGDMSARSVPDDCTCASDPTRETICPYASEMGDTDAEAACHCCDSCADQCADDL